MDIEPSFASKQRSVQRKLGRCLMRLQQVELIVKALWVGHELFTYAGDTADVLAERKAKVGGKTLGLVVKELMGSYLTPDLGRSREDENDNTPPTNNDARISFRTTSTISLSLQDYERTADQLNALVEMRNDLVHHFIQRFDLWSDAGCDKADFHLDTCYGEIDKQYSVMLGWAKSNQEAFAATATYIASDEFLHCLQVGIRPDGPVDWATCTIIKALRQAEEKLAQNGWTSLDEAVGWIKTEYPDERPALYGCSRWRHLLHESRLFQIQRAGPDKIVAMRTFFRSKRERTETTTPVVGAEGDFEPN